MKDGKDAAKLAILPSIMLTTARSRGTISLFEIAYFKTPLFYAMLIIMSSPDCFQCISIIDDRS